MNPQNIKEEINLSLYLISLNECKCKILTNMSGSNSTLYSWKIFKNDYQ